MARIPISIEKVKVESRTHNLTLGGFSTSETLKYLFKLEEKGQQWERTFMCDRESLLRLKEDIERLIENTTTDEILKISFDQAKVVDDHHKTDKLCNGCSYKMTFFCVTCLFELQSPLERQLFIELKKNNISFQSQYALNWRGEQISINGKTYQDPANNFKEVLTVVDFYISKSNIRLCVYTDGHSYHERTEDQALRDRNIDRKLQELGFNVLRYTGKEVNGNMSKIIEEINKWIGTPYR